MNKKIKFKDIVTIYNLLMDIYYEESWDYVDRRKVAGMNRSLYSILKKINADEEEQEKVRQAIWTSSFNTKDRTYTPICKKLRSLGYEIIFEEKRK